MIQQIRDRYWRLAVTLGPLVAIALTLGAGLKWRP
jgi:hypothetical protein